MAEAIARVERAGGELGRAVDRLRSNTQALLDQLREVDPQVAAALRSVQATELVFRRGGEISEEARRNYERLTEYLQDVGLPRMETRAVGPQAPRIEALAAWTREQLADLPQRPIPAVPIPERQAVVTEPPTVPPSETRSRPEQPTRTELDREEAPVPQRVTTPSAAPPVIPPVYEPRARWATQEDADDREEALAEEARLALERVRSLEADLLRLRDSDQDEDPSQVADVEDALRVERSKLAKVQAEQEALEQEQERAAPPPMPQQRAAVPVSAGDRGDAAEERKLEVAIERARQEIAAAVPGGDAGDQLRARIEAEDPLLRDLRQRLTAVRERRQAAMGGGEHEEPEGTYPRPLTAEERTAYEQKTDMWGQRTYSDEMLSRSHMIGPHTLMVPRTPPRPVAEEPPPERPELERRPDREAPTPDEGPERPPTERPEPARRHDREVPPDDERPTPERPERGEAPRPAARPSPHEEKAPEIERETQARDELDRAASREAERRRLEQLDNRALLDEWRLKTREVNEHARELEKLYDLQARKRVGLITPLAQYRLSQLEQAGLQETYAPLVDEQQLIREEAERRGMRPSGDLLRPAAPQAPPPEPPDGGGGGMNALSAFLGGAGMSRWLRAATPYGAAALAGYAVYRTATRLQGEYRDTLPLLQQQERLARAAGDEGEVGGVYNLLATGVPAYMRAYRTYGAADVLESHESMMRGMGRSYRDTPISEALDMATVTGRTLADQAQTLTRFALMGPRVDPLASQDVTRIFAGMHQGALPMTALPFFEESVAKLGSQMPPFQFAGVRGIAAQLATINEQLPQIMPGVEPGSPQALAGVAPALMQGLTARTERGNGILDEYAYTAILRLRDNPEVAERLRDPRIGIDINTFMGVREAVERAPELAQRFQLPDVMEAIIAEQERAMPDPQVRQMVLANSLGVSAQGARLFDTMDWRRTLDAAREPESRVGILPDAGRALDTPQAQAIWEGIHKDQAANLERGLAFAGVGGLFAGMSSRINEAMAGLTREVTDALGIGLDRIAERSGGAVRDVLQTEIEQ